MISKMTYSSRTEGTIWSGLSTYPGKKRSWPFEQNPSLEWINHYEFHCDKGISFYKYIFKRVFFLLLRFMLLEVSEIREVDLMAKTTPYCWHSKRNVLAHMTTTRGETKTMAYVEDKSEFTKPKDDATTKEREIVAEFCHLLEESRQLFKSLRWAVNMHENEKYVRYSTVRVHCFVSTTVFFAMRVECFSY